MFICTCNVGTFDPNDIISSHLNKFSGMARYRKQNNKYTLLKKKKKICSVQNLLSLDKIPKNKGYVSKIFSTNKKC